MKHAHLFICLLAIYCSACCATHKPTTTKTPPVDLLPGNADQWEPINFGGEGEIYLDDDKALNIEPGSPLSGAIYTGQATELFGESLDNYAITLQAQRAMGVDMFLGLTFPVGKDGHTSLILGGWAGAITGLSNLDGLNASENQTTQYHAFEDGKWYRIKVLVTPEKIQCWLDDKQIVNVTRADHEQYDTHGAVTDTKPFGMFTYGTWGKMRDIKVWKLD